MKFEKIEIGEKKKFILTNGMIFTVTVTELSHNFDTIYGTDKFGEDIMLSSESVSAVVPISGTQLKRYGRYQ